MRSLRSLPLRRRSERHICIFLHRRRLLNSRLLFSIVDPRSPGRFFIFYAPRQFRPERRSFLRVWPVEISGLSVNCVNLIITLPPRALKWHGKFDLDQRRGARGRQGWHHRIAGVLP